MTKTAEINYMTQTNYFTSYQHKTYATCVIHTYQRYIQYYTLNLNCLVSLKYVNLEKGILLAGK
jgi:hypothetical protein